MLELKNVTLDIPTFANPAVLDLRRAMVKAMIGAKVGQHRDKMISVRALDSVNLSIKSGDRIGLIGHNGAGKSSLLKVIGGVLPPTSGTISMNGRVRSFFNLGAGLDYNQTGRQNIKSMSLYYCQDFSQIKKCTDEIIDFTELGTFIDLPVATYSAGMVARLIFAVATSYPAEILLLDEMLGAGDISFMSKAQKRVESLIEQSGCIILASHSHQTIDQFCNTAIWMSGGQIKMTGSVNDVNDKFQAEMLSGK